MHRALFFVVFLLGLVALGWVGFGYAGTNLLALAITVMIGAFYAVGAVELLRFRAATATLQSALAAPPAADAPLAPWLARLSPSLRSAVRLRIEGERMALPAPVLTPYLTGLLVLLGMLGTFVGMVVTLNGTGIALESASDLQAIRASLAAPVKGLGLAFGTSLAGVATSAMLGLLSALCRRERLAVAQQLDAEIAGRLHAFSRGHQRDESFRLLQRQADQMPVLVDRLETLVAALQQQGQSIGDGLLAGQDRFHGNIEQAYTRLAASVEHTVQQSLTDSAKVASRTLQPVVEATMTGIAQQAQALHEVIERSVQAQLEGLSGRFEASTATVAGLWQDAVAEQQRAGTALAGQLEHTLGRFTTSFESRSEGLVQGIGERLAQTADRLQTHWSEALDAQRSATEQGAAAHRQALEAAAASFVRGGEALLHGAAKAHDAQQLAVTQREDERLAAWKAGLESTTALLRAEWERAAAQAEGRQQALQTALVEGAEALAERTEAQARRTIDEVARLAQEASQAPRAAAELIAELRQKLDEGMARDRAMLEERTHMLETLSTLLDAVHHASGEQRAAIDRLVTGSTELLDRVGAQFARKAEEEAGKLGESAAQLTGSAVEVASLGEAFGEAVQVFGQTSERLGAQLERIEAALGKSMTRSDEQLAYYVAQAREVIDLSLMSQKQIVEELQQLARGQTASAPVIEANES